MRLFHKYFKVPYSHFNFIVFSVFLNLHWYTFSVAQWATITSFLAEAWKLLVINSFFLCISCHMMTVFGKQVVDHVQRVIIAKSAALKLCVNLSCTCYVLVLCCEDPAVDWQTTNYSSVRQNSGKVEGRGDFLTEWFTCVLKGLYFVGQLTVTLRDPNRSL